MPTPTTQATNLTATLVNSDGFRLTFTKGNGNKRLVSVTKGSDIKYPIDGEKYDASLKYGNGDQLISFVGATGTCYPYPPYPDPIEATASSTASTTYVVYDGFDDGINGLDIIGLEQQSSYTVTVFEHNNYCYATSSTLSVTTGIAPNKRSMKFTVYDNFTRKPIKNADIAIKDRRGFISDFGKTNDYGVYSTRSLEEGRYESSIVATNYESKVMGGLFIQRQEPLRDNQYRMFTSAGNTEFGGTVNRDRLQNKNDYKVFLDPLNTTAHSFNKYNPSQNPSNLTGL
jgi:hypothetical protein